MYIYIYIKLNNPEVSFKTYWSILRSFYNGKKIPLILLTALSLILKRKRILIFFASQCNPLKNSSSIPNTQAYIIDTVIDTIKLNDDDINKIIRNLGTNKAHGHDIITIRMIKLFDCALVKPHSMIYKNCISACKFPDMEEIK